MALDLDELKRKMNAASKEALPNEVARALNSLIRAYTGLKTDLAKQVAEGFSKDEIDEANEIMTQADACMTLVQRSFEELNKCLQDVQIKEEGTELYAALSDPATLRKFGPSKFSALSAQAKSSLETGRAGLLVDARKLYESLLELDKEFRALLKQLSAISSDKSRTFEISTSEVKGFLDGLKAILLHSLRGIVPIVEQHTVKDKDLQDKVRANLAASDILRKKYEAIFERL